MNWITTLFDWPMRGRDVCLPPLPLWHPGVYP